MPLRSSRFNKGFGMTLVLQNTVRNQHCTYEIFDFVDGCCGENLVSSRCFHTPFWPSTLFECQSLLLPDKRAYQRAGRKRGLVLNCKKGRVIWGTVFGPTAAASLPRGLPPGRITQEPCSNWRVENFAKTSVLFGCSKYFQNRWLSQSSYFIKPLQISTVFLLFHVDMEAKERKNVATCVCVQLFISKC